MSCTNMWINDLTPKCTACVLYQFYYTNAMCCKKKCSDDSSRTTSHAGVRRWLACSWLSVCKARDIILVLAQSASRLAVVIKRNTPLAISSLSVCTRRNIEMWNWSGWRNDHVAILVYNNDATMCACIDCLQKLHSCKFELTLIPIAALLCSSPSCCSGWKIDPE